MLNLRISGLACLAGATVIAMLSAGQSLADEKTVGKEEFRLRCSVCHGMTGLGDGPVGQLLKTPAPNLALISERNGGSFPFK